MTRQLDVVGTSELAKRLGITKQRASQIKSEAGFPRPAATLAMGPVWRRADIEKWIEETGWTRRAV